ncbi:hypothetical protein E2C01_099189 [Portunus trituberculatus]|uniref:Uncharacterized protein n=1 Tax=Portunus trituberculatus TaxID=210409 RepID=A0A5B7KE91_PORTR|nr:hypothetical protein [Portunus trituberculatus]
MDWDSVEAVDRREIGEGGIEGVGVVRWGRSHARHTAVRASPRLPVTINLTPPHYCIRSCALSGVLVRSSRQPVSRPSTRLFIAPLPSIESALPSV